ncbi:hypothetical protein HDU98_010284 [Podochytrium sp. JEL0797]|nr:hypothetical protein HDU98_010284 [Podochytrium sp. JEL0797]
MAQMQQQLEALEIQNRILVTALGKVSTSNSLPQDGTGPPNHVQVAQQSDSPWCENTGKFGHPTTRVTSPTLKNSAISNTSDRGSTASMDFMFCTPVSDPPVPNTRRKSSFSSILSGITGQYRWSFASSKIFRAVARRFYSYFR